MHGFIQCLIEAEHYWNLYENEAFMSVNDW